MIPNFIKTAPQSELSKKLYGESKIYSHMIVCNADRRKPIGEPGCICLRYLKTKPLDIS
jgi:hypothetical protein